MIKARAKEVVFLNGNFICAKVAGISAFEPGSLYGFGIFETMRSYQDRIVYLDEHLERFIDASGMLSLRFSYSKRKLKEIIKKTVFLSGFTDAYIKLVLSKAKEGMDVLVITREYKPLPLQKYERGFYCALSRFRQGEDSLLARIKTTSRALFELSLHEARQRGFDEAIILNGRGYLAEASRSNLFLVKDRELFTPALECGCLDGITRKAVFDLASGSGIRASEGNFTPQDLYAADEAFLTNSLMGIMPLTGLEKNKIRKGTPGRITGYLRRKYLNLLKRG